MEFNIGVDLKEGWLLTKNRFLGESNEKEKDIKSLEDLLMGHNGFIVFKVAKVIASY